MLRKGASVLPLSPLAEDTQVFSRVTTLSMFQGIMAVLVTSCLFCPVTCFTPAACVLFFQLILISDVSVPSTLNLFYCFYLQPHGCVMLELKKSIKCTWKIYPDTQTHTDEPLWPGWPLIQDLVLTVSHFVTQFVEYKLVGKKFNLKFQPEGLFSCILPDWKQKEFDFIKCTKHGSKFVHFNPVRRPDVVDGSLT